MATYYKIVGVSEAAVDTFMFTNSPKWAIGISRITGANTSSPINASQDSTRAVSQALTVAPSITTTVANTLVLAFYTTITCPNDTLVGCASLVPPSNINSVTITGGNTPTVSHLKDSVNRANMADSSCLNKKIIYRIYQAVNACGTTRCIQKITVCDTIKPILVAVGRDTTVSCIALVPGTSNVTATDNCATPS